MSEPPQGPVSVDDVRAFAVGLPRTHEALVRGRVKFRVGSIVYASFSHDGTVMGVGFPRDWRPVVVEAEPDVFMFPGESDMRFNWIHVRLAAIDHERMRELVLDGWELAVPKRVAAEYAATHGLK